MYFNEMLIRCVMGATYQQTLSSWTLIMVGSVYVCAGGDTLHMQ